MRQRFSTGVVVGALLVTVVSGGTVAIAATTAFNLNTMANSVTASTGASGSITGNLFTLTDNSSSSGSPLALVNNSDASGATALRLSVKPGRAPLTVNSGTKVVHLNADKLDGIDSTGFIHGKGTTYTLAVAVQRSQFFDMTKYVPSPAVAPGFFNVSLECPGLSNDTPLAVDFGALIHDGPVNMFGRNDHVPNAVYLDLDHSTWGPMTDPSGDLTEVTMNGLPSGVQTSALVSVATIENPDSCYMQIQAVITKQ